MRTKAETKRAWILTLCCGLSGAASLVHELLWTRRLELLLGTSLHTAAAVLAVTLGGMALGAHFAGGREDSRSEGALAYARYELLLALYCLLLPALQGVTDPVFAAVFQNGGAFTGFLRSALAMTLVLPGAMLMGATFPPAVADLVASCPGDPAGRLARVYGANTFGAFLGALGGGLVLRPWLGTDKTLWVACLLSALAGGLALALGPPPKRTAEAKTSKKKRRGGAPRHSPPAVSESGRAIVYAIYGLSGFTALAYEVLLHRMASLWIGGSTYAFAMVLAVFLLGLSLGGAMVRERRLARLGSFGGLAALQLGVTFWVLGLGCVAGRLPLILAESARYEAVGFGALLAIQFLVLMVLLLPGAVCLGATLPTAASALGITAKDSAGLVGRLYMANSTGCVFGALLGGHLLLPYLGLRGALLAVGVINLGSAALAAWQTSSFRSWRLVLMATAVSFFLVPNWDAAILSSGPYIYSGAYQDAASRGLDVEGVIRGCGDVIFHRDGAYATTTVRKAPGGLISLQVNGKTDASNKADLFTQRLVGNLPLLAHPEPKDVLVIGLGSGVTAGAVLDHPIKKMDLLEIAPEVVEASRYFDDLTGAPLDDDRTELRVEDGRAWIQWTDRTYDVISSEPSNPWVAGMANLFTEEYFRASRARLNEGGVMVQWVQAYSTSPDDFRSVVATFSKVFPKVSLWRSINQTDFVLLGLTADQAPDARRIIDALEGQDPRGRALRAGGLDARQFALSFVTGSAGVAALAEGAQIVTDDDPFLEFTGPRNLYKDLTAEVQAMITKHEDSGALATTFTGAAPLLAYHLAVRDAFKIRTEAIQLAAGGKGQEALALLEGVLDNIPGDKVASDAYALLLKDAARSYRKKELPAAALVALDRLLARVPKEYDALHLRGVTLSQLGRWKEARRDLEVVIGAVPQERTALRNLSVVLHKLGETENALNAFLLCLKGTRPSAPEWRNLGSLYQALGRFPKAALAWKKSLELNPNQPTIQELMDAFLIVSGAEGVATNLDDSE